MSLHPSTFEYLKPSEDQLKAMTEARQCADVYAKAINAILPDGPDKTYIMRQIRTTAMWVNVALTRHADGSPR